MYTNARTESNGNVSVSSLFDEQTIRKIIHEAIDIFGDCSEAYVMRKCKISFKSAKVYIDKFTC